MEEKEIYIDNLRINYKIAGEGQSILILHGWGSSSRSWAKIQDILVQNGFKVIIPDLPGFGKSGSLYKTWDLGQYANFIIEFCRQLKIGRFNLVGHSFGGRISIKLAVQEPDELENLILIDSAGIKQELNLRKKTIIYFSKLFNSLSKIKIIRPLIEKLKRISYKTILKNKDYAKLKNNVMRETFKKIIQENLLPSLKKIKIRTLLIWGKKDKLVPVRYAYIFKKEIPYSELEIIPQAGHSPYKDFPQETANLITKFILK